MDDLGMPKTFWFINQYSSTPQTGIGGRSFYLAKELAKKGHRVYLIAASYTHLLRHPPKVEQQFTIEQVDGVNFVWVKLPEYRGAHDKKRVLNCFKFAWHITRLKNVITDAPDAILVSSPSLISYLGAEYLSKHYACKLVFEVRDIWPLTLIELGGYSPKHPFIRLMQWIEDRAYRRADAVLSNLPNAVEHMVSRGMTKEKFTWIPNGFDLNEVTTTMPLSDEVKNQIPNNKFVVGYTGTLGVANALDTFIDAARLLKADKEIVFLLVGDGKEKSDLVNKSFDLENVNFIDVIPKHQIQSMLSLFNVCYIGLTKDPLFRFGVSPNKLFDYLLSGSPILYAIESGKYIPVSDANAGISVPAEDPQSVADAIIKLKAMSPEERQQLGENGKKYAMEHHDYAKLAERLERVLF